MEVVTASHDFYSRSKKKKGLLYTPYFVPRFLPSRLTEISSSLLTSRLTEIVPAPTVPVSTVLVSTVPAPPSSQSPRSLVDRLLPALHRPRRRPRSPPSLDHPRATVAASTVLDRPSLHQRRLHRPLAPSSLHRRAASSLAVVPAPPWLRFPPSSQSPQRSHAEPSLSFAGPRRSFAGLDRFLSLTFPPIYSFVNFMLIFGINYKLYSLNVKNLFTKSKDAFDKY
ncbi:hypothetical protein Scep_022573 [Stephania cephalantha]|uniref:Uncharacterized protein n=1 Tax=Stephania cephalantha TaxID=152367 RepID=A0AAP0FI58_9MAGN